jgi:hypothetical protein
MTCSDDSKPPGWIEPPDGWEWNSSKNEYVKNSTGVRIRYMPNLNLWNVLIPSVRGWYIPGYAGYVPLNLEDALKKF